MDGWTDGPTDRRTDGPTTRLLELLRAAKKTIFLCVEQLHFVDRLDDFLCGEVA